MPELVFKIALKALILRKDPKYWLFFTQTENGRRSAEKFLARLEERTEDRDDPISVQSFLSQLRAIRRWGRQEPDDLSRLDLPVLVANDITDLMVPHHQFRRPRPPIPGAELLLFPDSGHGGIFQYHDEFTDRVLKFLA